MGQWTVCTLFGVFLSYSCSPILDHSVSNTHHYDNIHRDFEYLCLDDPDDDDIPLGLPKGFYRALLPHNWAIRHYVWLYEQAQPYGLLYGDVPFGLAHTPA